MSFQSGYIAVPRALDTAALSEKLTVFRQATGLAADTLACVEQVHGRAIVDVSEAGDGLGVVGKADAMITKVSGIALIIRTADCVPVIIADAYRGVVGIAHAGWKGVLAGVLGHVIERMETQYGCSSADMGVILGPSICGRHYDVSTVADDRVARFEKQFSVKDGVVLREQNAVRLDLPQACLVQCRRFGVPTQSIQLPKACTVEDRHLPSHRREGEQRQNHVWSWVCLSKP